MPPEVPDTLVDIHIADTLTPPMAVSEDLVSPLSATTDGGSGGSSGTVRSNK